MPDTDILKLANKTERKADVVEIHYFPTYGRASPLTFMCDYAGI